MITVSGYDGAPFAQNHEESWGGRFLRQYLKLTFSGNYTTGGDALDLTNAGGSAALPNTLSPASSIGVVSIDVVARGPAAGVVAGGGGYSIVTPNSDAPLSFADLALLKMVIFNLAAQYAQGAYGTDVTNDSVILEVVYAR